MKREARFGKVVLALAVSLLVAASVSAFAASVTSDSPLGTAGVGKAEVSMGDLVADAIRASIGADVGIVSASELKERDAQVARGKVSTDDITPYIAYTDDPIVEVRLTGRQIKQALERSVVIYPQKNLGFLQVSGISFSFDPSKPQEDRITSVRVNGASIQDSQSYSVAMTSSMANGALGYWKIWSKNDIRRVTQTTIPQAIDSFFAAKGSISYSNLNRIAVGG